MDDSQGFVFCAALDGKGSAHEIVGEYSKTWQNHDGTVWYHLDSSDPSVGEWLATHSGLSDLTVQTLVSEDTRPRVTAGDGGLVICLRGVNCNPGSDPDDMVSLRLWVSENRVLTMRRRRMEAINDIRASLGDGSGPSGSGNFLVSLCDTLTRRIASVVDEIDEGVDGLEDEILEQERATLRTRILKYRRMIIGLRKYVIPQREALSRLQNERAAWLSDMDRLQLRETAERTNRCIDDLDAARDRAAMAQEELNARLSEQMNQTIFMMSIVATIFLPLGLLTGLLGINVGGIPGADLPWAFAAVCGILVVTASFLYFLFKRKQII
jgi:zinc transporter